MLIISIDPVVLFKLRQAFPKPTNAAVKALENYRLLLQDILNNGARYKRPPIDVLLNHYTADVRRLSQEGPRIGRGKMRLHSWLTSNNLSLIEFIEKGSNLSGLRSKIKVSSLATLTNPIMDVIQKLQVAETDHDVDKAMDGTQTERQALFENLYPDFYDLNTKQRKEAYEFVSVDLASLRAYIYWLNTESTHINLANQMMRTEQALQILRVAVFTGGKYLQKRKPSDFGRMYYEGVSTQNVSKDLRRAMLGNCWEYDIRSSVIAFKLSFVNEILAQEYSAESARRTFAFSYYYVEKKDSMIAEICNETFGASKELSSEKKVALIKQALTAIGFGATARESSWKNERGEWVNSSLKGILRNSEQRYRFINHYAVKCFIQEQEIFDEYICNLIKVMRPDIWNSVLVKSGKQVSRSKVVAMVYQHMESIAMNAARKVIAAQGNKVLTSVHDAVLVRRRIGREDLIDVMEAMQTATQNPHLRLKGTQYERYVRYSIEPEDPIDLGFSVDGLLEILATSFPEGYVPDDFNFESCMKEF